MQIEFSEQPAVLRRGVAQTVESFGEDDRSACDTDHRFPREFHRAMAAGGWLGITMPEELGGAALGVTQAAIMMQTRSGWALTFRLVRSLCLLSAHAACVPAIETPYVD